MKNTLIAFGLMAAVSTGNAAVTTITALTINDVTPSGNRQLVSFTAGGIAYGASQLKTGASSNTAGVSTPTPVITLLPNIDDAFNLSTINANAGGGSAATDFAIKIVDFGGTDFTSGKLSPQTLDFFIFEAGASSGDSIGVAPIFSDGSVGTMTLSISSWGNTGVQINGPTQGTQNIQGVGFAIEDLKDNLGNNLASNATIKGIAITSGGGVDLAGIYALVPEPSSAVLASLGLGGLALRRRRA